jgi:hypothetical protein
MGVGIGVANVHAVTLRQTAVSESVRGRVNAAYWLISWGAIPRRRGGRWLPGRAGGRRDDDDAFSAAPRLRSIDETAA